MNLAPTSEQLKQNYQQILSEIAQSALQANRAPEDITLIAVSKYVTYPVCKQLIEIGANNLGESRPQLLVSKAKNALQDGLSVQWHQIGHLQTNKIREILPYTTLIHSVDSVRLLDELEDCLNKYYPEHPLQNILLEVNYEQEENKTGLSPEIVPAILEYALSLSRIKVVGLMAMGALGSSEAQAQKTFASVRQLRDQLQQTFGNQVNLSELSMGMSHDFHQAILEGATMVRVGSRLFD